MCLHFCTTDELINHLEAPTYFLKITHRYLVRLHVRLHVRSKDRPHFPSHSASQDNAFQKKCLGSMPKYV